MKVYVGNLPYSVDNEKLKELFSSYGEIEEATIISDKFSGKSKGFGFITFVFTLLPIPASASSYVILPSSGIELYLIFVSN